MQNEAVTALTDEVQTPSSGRNVRFKLLQRSQVINRFQSAKDGLNNLDKVIEVK